MSISLAAFGITNTVQKKYTLPDLRLRTPELLYPRRKPVGAVKIDWTNPLNKDLSFLSLFNTGDATVSDLVSKRSTTEPYDAARDDIVQAHTSEGKVLRCTGNDNRVLLPTELGISTEASDNWTFTFKCENSANGRIILSGSNNAFIQFHSGGLRITGSGSTLSAQASGIVNPTGLHTYSIVKVGTTYSFYMDGVFEEDDTDVEEGITALRYWFTYLDGNTSFDYSGDMYFFSHHKRPLTSSEISALHNNPYQVLKPVQPRVVLKDAQYQPIKEATTNLIGKALPSFFANKVNYTSGSLASSTVVRSAPSKIPEQQLPITIPDIRLLRPELRYPSRIPVGNLEIDYSNPHTRGLTTAILLYGDTPRDYIQNVALDKTNDPERTPLGYVFNGNDYFELPNVRIESKNSVTFRVDIPYRSGSSFQYLNSWRGSGSNELEWYLAEANFVLYRFSQLASAHGYSFNHSGLGTDQISTATWVDNGSGFTDAFANGSFVNRTYNYSAQSGGVGTLRIGSRSPSAAYYLRGTVGFHYIHDRELTRSEVASLHRDPYQIFKPATGSLVRTVIVEAPFNVGYFLPDSRLHAPGHYYPRRKPEGNVVVSQTNPFSKDLVFLSGFEHKDLINGYDGHNTTPAVISNRGGTLLLDYAGDPAYGVTYGNSQEYHDEGMTITAVIKPEDWSPVDSRGIISRNNNTAASGRWAIYLSGGNISAYRDSGATIFLSGTVPASIDDNTEHIVSWTTSKSSTDQDKIYIDGVEVASRAASDVATPYIDLDLRVGALAGSGTDGHFEGEIGCTMIHNKRMSAEEVAELHRSPYQVLEPR